MPPLPSKAPASDLVDVDVQFEDLVERAIEYVLGQNLRRRRCCVRSCACAISRLLSRGVCVCVCGGVLARSYVKTAGCKDSSGDDITKEHLRTVYRLFRDVLDIPNDPEELAVLQRRFADHGTVEMLYVGHHVGCGRGFGGTTHPMNPSRLSRSYTQMCEAPRDQGVYLDLLETAIKCLQGGNLHVQTQFLDLLRVSHKALTVMMRQLRAASASLREAATQASAGASGSIALLLGVQVSLDAATQRTDAAGDSIAKAVAGGGSYAATAARRAGDAIPMTTVTKVILRFLQVLCEGHNLEMQNFLRTQGGKAGATNLVAEAVSVLRDIQPHLVAPSSAQVDAVELAIQVRSRPCVAMPRGGRRPVLTPVRLLCVFCRRWIR